MGRRLRSQGSLTNPRCLCCASLSTLLEAGDEAKNKTGVGRISALVDHKQKFTC